MGSRKWNVVKFHAKGDKEMYIKFDIKLNKGSGNTREKPNLVKLPTCE